MNNDVRNCRCCLAAYEKKTGYWCEIPIVDKKKRIVKPVGFCEFCDRNNKEWYTPNLKCHNKDSCSHCPDGHAEFIYGHCKNCGAIESVVKYWEEKGKFFDGKNLHDL